MPRRLRIRRQFTLDGDEVDILDFLAVNYEDKTVDPREINELKVGQSILYGGGAFAESVLKRTR